MDLHEGTPQDLGAMVIKTLKEATSQDPNVLKQAESQLCSWQTQSGFCTKLMEVILDKSLDEHVRWIAVISLKNGVDCYWRKTAPNAFSAAEKTSIRQGLLQCFTEPVQQIGVQLALLISKIARLDFPDKWPELFPSLYDNIQSPVLIVHQRALLTLHHVVKQLASKRLCVDRTVFQELTPQVFKYLLHLWMPESSRLFTLDKTSPDFPTCFERCRMSLKILRRLCFHGYKDPHKSPDVCLFLDSVLERIKPSVAMFPQFACETSAQESVGKYACLHLKVIINLFEVDPSQFGPYMKRVLDVSCFYTFTEEGQGFAFKKLLLQCFDITRGIMDWPSKYSQITISPEMQAIKNEIFTEKVVQHMVRVLISHYFLMDEESLRCWDANPEEFFLELMDRVEAVGPGMTTQYLYSLRTGVEYFFSHLGKKHPDYVFPVLQEMIMTCRDLVPPDDMTGLLRKEAIYNAAGILAFDFVEFIDFDQWLKETLIHELKIPDSNYRILRRRIIWLIHFYFPHVREMDYVMVGEALTHLLSNDNDLVVRLSTAWAFREIENNTTSTFSEFRVNLPFCFSCILNLLSMVEECESKMYVLESLAAIILTVGRDIQQHVGPLLQFLPQLWLESADHDQLRIAILGLLSSLIQATKNESEGLHEFVIPVIKQSTCVSNKSYVYVNEDAMNLWLDVLENATKGSSELLDLYENVFPVLEQSTDSMKTVLSITNIYIVLCPDTFIPRYGEKLVKCALFSMPETKSEAVAAAWGMYEMMLKVLGSEGANLMLHIFPFVFESLMSNQLSFSDLSSYLSIVARFVLYNESAFFSGLQMLANRQKKRVEDVFDRLVQVWALKLNLVYPTERRKISAMGLTHLCGMNLPAVVNHWSVAVTSIAEVIFDLTLENSTEDRLVVHMTNEERQISYPEEEFSEHLTRLAKLSRHDPVHTTSLREYLGQKMKMFQQQAGTAVMNQLTENVEIDCKQLLLDITKQMQSGTSFY